MGGRRQLAEIKRQQCIWSDLNRSDTRQGAVSGLATAAVWWEAVGALDDEEDKGCTSAAEEEER